MQYFGGKQRISKELSTFLNGELKENQPFVDMFCGSCNVVTKINPKRLRVANDKHTPLISMWKYLQTGGKLPDVVTEEDYYRTKADGPDHFAGFVGFGLSFAGKWWGGYARSGNRDYLQNAKNSLNKKLVHLQDVCFLNYDYKDCPLPDGCLVYCDIPYKNTTPYCRQEVGIFEHDEFYSWCKSVENKGFPVYVSEYDRNVPKEASVVFSLESKQDIRSGDGSKVKTREVVFRFY